MIRENGPEWTEFTQWWWREFGGARVSVADVCERLYAAPQRPTLPPKLEVVMERGGHAFRTWLGRHLSRVRVTPIPPGFRFAVHGRDGRTRSLVWRLHEYPAYRVPGAAAR